MYSAVIDMYVHVDLGYGYTVCCGVILWNNQEFN